MRLAWTYIALLATALPALAEVTATAILSPPSVPIYRTARYVVEVEGPKGLAVPSLDLGDALKGVDIATESPESTPLDDDRERVRIAFTLDASEAGQFTIPGRTLDLGNGQKAELPALTLSVHEPTEAETAQVQQFIDIGDPALVAPPQPRVWLYAGLGIALLAALAFGVWYWQKHRKVETWTPPALKPWQVANNRLDELASRRLPQQGRFEPFYVDSSAILRYYIEDRFHLHAPERTTPEFLEEAGRAGVLSETQQGFLEKFLRHCDRVKFARYEPGFEEMETSYAAVRGFVLETTPRLTAAEAEKEAA